MKPIVNTFTMQDTTEILKLIPTILMAIAIYYYNYKQMEIFMLSFQSAGSITW